MQCTWESAAPSGAVPAPPEQVPWAPRHVGALCPGSYCLPAVCSWQGVVLVLPRFGGRRGGHPAFSPFLLSSRPLTLTVSVLHKVSRVAPAAVGPVPSPTALTLKFQSSAEAQREP